MVVTHLMGVRVPPSEPCGSLAQLEERLVLTQDVGGSRPSRPTRRAADGESHGLVAGTPHSRQRLQDVVGTWSRASRLPEQFAAASLMFVLLDAGVTSAPLTTGGVK